MNGGFMLAGLFALAILIMRLFPQTPLARRLHFSMVELPLQIAFRMERRHLILMLVLLCCGQSLAVLGSADLMMIYAVDLSFYFDAMLTVYLAASVTRVSSVWSQCKSVIARLVAFRPRARARRAKAAVRPSKAPSNDDGPGWRSLPLAA